MTRPLCKCHGEPARWQRDPRLRAGGYWKCRVREQEWELARRRRQGIPAAGSAEYLAKVRVAEPAYRTMHHRARKELSDCSCAHCGSRRKVSAALRHDGSPSARRLSPKGSPYSIKVEDYMALCPGCHSEYDGVSDRVRRWHAERANAA